MNETLEQLALREAIARAICRSCGDAPDHVGDAGGNAYRWQDYLPCADAAIAELEKQQEQVFINKPDYNYEAMGCGLEDRNITDRYEAMRYGWECAVERIFDQIPDGPLYTHPTTPQQAAVPDDSADLLLRAVFQVCEATEDIEPKNDFERGRVFEAKGIRRGIGNWFQDTFCGRSFMGEPAMLSAAPVLPTDDRTA